MTNWNCVRIDIIGGFLGAGKTTFLNKLLDDGLKSERVVIIENEFGDEAVDDAILQDAGIEMRTLRSGCICCTLKSSFIRSIEDIVERCNPDRILIEPTGLASPSELQDTCKFVEQLEKLPVDVRLNSITAIVDATDAIEMLEYKIPVYINQIAEAHLIVLSHTQELDIDQLAEVRAAISETAMPHTDIIDTPWDNIDALEILTLSEQTFSEHKGTDTAERPGNDHHVKARDHEGGCHHDGHEHHHGHEGFVSRVVTELNSYDERAIEELTATLRTEGAVRAKGFLPRAEGGFAHYEYVNGRASAAPTTYDGPAKLVIITRR